MRLIPLNERSTLSLGSRSQQQQVMLTGLPCVQQPLLMIASATQATFISWLGDQQPAVAVIRLFFCCIG